MEKVAARSGKLPGSRLLTGKHWGLLCEILLRRSAHVHWIQVAGLGGEQTFEAFFRRVNYVCRDELGMVGCCVIWSGAPLYDIDIYIYIDESWSVCEPSAAQVVLSQRSAFEEEEDADVSKNQCVAFITKVLPISNSNEDLGCIWMSLVLYPFVSIISIHVHQFGTFSLIGHGLNLETHAKSGQLARWPLRAEGVLFHGCGGHGRSCCWEINRQRYPKVILHACNTLPLPMIWRRVSSLNTR